jgi:hypothetical protein
VTDQSIPAATTVQSVVHSFTQAELALTEVAGAVARFRAASEQLAAAEAGTAVAVAALNSATDASDRVATQLEGLVAGLGETVAALRAVDPERLWAHLEASEQQRAADRDASARESRLLLRVSAISAAGAIAAAVMLALLVLRIVAL